jgi:hypothetical protein
LRRSASATANAFLNRLLDSTVSRSFCQTDSFFIGSSFFERSLRDDVARGNSREVPPGVANDSALVEFADGGNPQMSNVKRNQAIDPRWKKYESLLKKSAKLVSTVQKFTPRLGYMRRLRSLDEQRIKLLRDMEKFWRS